MRTPELITKAILAIAANAVAVLTSLQMQIEFALRCASLCVGIGVGLLTAWSILRKKRD